MTVTVNGTTGVSAVQSGVVTQADLAPNVVGNGPCFSAYQSVAQSIPLTAYTKVILQSVDPLFPNIGFTVGATAGDLLSRFQPTVAGYYQFNGNCQLTSTGFLAALIYKNGVNTKQGAYTAVATVQPAVGISALLYLNGTSDYVELFVYSSVAAPLSASSVSTYFQGFLARSA